MKLPHKFIPIFSTFHFFFNLFKKFEIAENVKIESLVVVSQRKNKMTLKARTFLQERAQNRGPLLTLSQILQCLMESVKHSLMLVFSSTSVDEGTTTMSLTLVANDADSSSPADTVAYSIISSTARKQDPLYSVMTFSE